MHIPPFDNLNKPIVGENDANVPLTYFNIVKLEQGQAFTYCTPGYETCIVPATGKIDVEVEGERYSGIGQRTTNVWDGEPEGVYVPTATTAEFVCTSNSVEGFIAGAKYDTTSEPFAVRADEIDMVQYG